MLDVPQWLIFVYAGVVGALVGSFLNVVVARLPAGESIVRPRSRCPRCKSTIRWYDNVPVVSWVVLRGRCRRCGERISARYVVVELLMAALSLALVARFGVSWQLLVWFPLVAAFLAIVYLDIDHFWVPDVIVLPAMVWAALGSFLPGGVTAVQALIGLGPALALWGFMWLFERITGREGMGLGDVKLLAVMGLALGAVPTLIVLLLASVQGSIIGIAVLATGGHEAKAEAQSPSSKVEETAPARAEEPWVPPPRAIPFGPFLILACYEVLLAPRIFFHPIIDLMSVGQ